MRTELVTIPTDTLPLDGAFYEPAGGATAGGVLLFHGNTMNFYVGAPRFLPPALTALGFACLAFNRRGHDILSIRNSRAAEGAAFQTTAEGIADMLAVQHVTDYPGTPALVLLSAHTGGTGQVEGASRAGLMAGDRLDEIVAQARAMVVAGRGRDLLLMPGWWYVATAESFLDRMVSMPAIVDLAPSITCPVLFIRGDRERVESYPAEEFQGRAGGPCDVEIVPECDHFYIGREDRVTEIVASWLKRTLVC